MWLWGCWGSLQDVWRAEHLWNPTPCLSEYSLFSWSSGLCPLPWGAFPCPSSPGANHRDPPHLVPCRYRIRSLSVPPCVVFLGVA